MDAKQIIKQDLAVEKLTAKNTAINGTLSVSGATTLGNTTTTGTETVNGKATFKNGVDVTGGTVKAIDATFSGNVSVGGNINFGNMTVGTFEATTIRGYTIQKFVIKDDEFYSDIGVYDIVISNQEDFRKLVRSLDWHGAKTVAFKGNNGVFDIPQENAHGRSDTLYIPSSVERITGFNNVIFKPVRFGYATQNAVLCEGSTIIENITIDIDGSDYGVVDGKAVQGGRIKNCSITVNADGGDTSYSLYGFSDCELVEDCSVSFLGDLNIEQDIICYYNCQSVTRCKASKKNVIQYAAKRTAGFSGCKDLVSCYSDIDTGAQGDGELAASFINCEGLWHCRSKLYISRDGGESYDYFNCFYASCCKAEQPSGEYNKTAIWGGINSKIDSDSCDMDEII